MQSLHVHASTFTQAGAVCALSLADINNLAANVDAAARVPLDLKMGSFTDVIMEDEVSGSKLHAPYGLGSKAPDFHMVIG